MAKNKRGGQQGKMNRLLARETRKIREAKTKNDALFVLSGALDAIGGLFKSPRAAGILEDTYKRQWEPQNFRE